LDLLLFAHLSSSSAIAPLVAGLIRWKSLSYRLKLVVYLALISLLSDLLCLVLIKFKINTWPVGNLFLILQFALLFLAMEQKTLRLVRLFFYGCLLFGVVNFLFIQPPTAFNSYTSYVYGILLIVYALAFLYQLMNEMPVEHVQSLPMFWIAFGVLVYYGGNLFLFLFNNYLMVHLPKSHQAIWNVHNVLNISKNVFLFVALCLNYTSKTSQR
jgi:hypothetical protein